MVGMLPKAFTPQGLIVLVLWLQREFLGILASEKVYFDKYGHCSRAEPFELKDESYEALPKGGGFSHESLDCSLSFKAASGYGVCMSFDDFMIEDCSVRLLIYESKSQGGDVWKEMTCETVRPSQMCSSGRYVTLRVLKDRLNKNKGYNFEIEIEQSSSVSDEGVVFASIGFVIGIICGVVLLLIIIIAFAFACFNRNRKRRSEETTCKHAVPADQIQPSAPPLLEGEDNSAIAMHQHQSHLYPHLQQDRPMLDPPPPYEQPPSYSPQHPSS